MCGHRAQTWKFARSQVSAALFYVQTVTFVRACMDLYRRARASRLQAMDRRCYLSQTLVRRSPGLPDLLRPPALGGNSVWASIWSATQVIHCNHQVCKQAYQPRVLIVEGSVFLVDNRTTYTFRILSFSSWLQLPPPTRHSSFLGFPLLSRQLPT